MVAAPDLGCRPPLRGAQGRPLLPALRDRALLPRGRPGLPRRRGSVGLCPPPGDRAARSARGGRQPARLDDDPVDADLARRGRRRGRDRVRARPASATRSSCSPARGPSRCSAEDAEVLATFSGAELEGTRYEAPFDYIAGSDFGPLGHSVLLGDFVTTEDGTGLVHTAPRLRRGRLPARRAVRDDAAEPGPRPTATTTTASRTSRASTCSSTTRRSSPRSRRRGGCIEPQVYEHAYPHCWRCGTPLLYYAKASWYIRTTDVRDRMLAENERIGWRPGPRQARALRQVAGGQRRLGALARALLGYAAADLGVHGPLAATATSAPVRSPSSASAPATSPTICTARSSTTS